MRPLRKITDDPEEYYQYFLPEYEEPLIEYVRLLANKYMPVTQMDFENGYYVSRAIGIFVIRYFEKKIENNFPRKKFPEFFFTDKNLKETIITMGYDIDKFWYLLLFIYDFSFGYCYRSIEIDETPRELMYELIDMINKNISSTKKNSDILAKSPMSLSLKIKGKHGFNIEDPRTLHYLALVLEMQLEALEKGLAIDESYTTGKTENGKLIYDTLSGTKQIAIFAKIFFSFFELKPPIKGRIKKGSAISYSKNLLISKLILLTGLSNNEKFIESDNMLKGYLNKNNDLNLDKLFNSLYI